MGVGRKRKDGNPLGLEPRVEWHHGQFRYLHRDGTKEGLGTDVGKANDRARIFNDPDGTYGTLGSQIQLFLAAARAGRLPADWKLGERTIEDYEEEAEFIKVSPLWAMYPLDIVREHKVLSDYRDNRVDPQTKKGKRRANIGLSLISSTFRWLIDANTVPGLQVNPVKLVIRYKQKAKDRYVEDHEYLPVYGIAVRSVCMALRLVYKTLQRPSDVLAFAPADVRTKTVNGLSKRILSVDQGKTGSLVDIELDSELEEILHMLSPTGVLGSQRLSENVTRMVPALVHTLDGQPYTEEGMGAMLRRYCVRAGVKTFGLMDVRAKGATDMYLDGVSLETIQRLMRHKSVQTTEIYIKRLLGTVSTVRPNAVAVGN